MFARSSRLFLLLLTLPSLALAQPAPAAPAPEPPAAPTAQPTPAPEPAAPATPAPDPAPVAEPVPAPAAEAPAIAPEAPAETPIAEPPRKLAVGTEGLFQPTALFQGWFWLNRAAETTTTFRLRRAEFKAAGDIVPGSVSYALMIDPAKVLDAKDTTLTVANQDPAPSDPDAPETVTVKQAPGAISMLQDVFLTFQTEYVDTSFGQFKIPVSWEGYNSSSKLLFAERALVGREYGDKRDIGLRFAKTFEYFGYSAGFFNGSGLNNLDTDNAKDGALRLEAYPLKDLVIAAVGYATLWDRDKSGSKDRIEFDARYDAGPVLVQAEYIRGIDNSPTAPAVKGHGLYGAVAVRLFDKKLEPALRVGYLDPNTDTNVDPATAKGKDEVVHVEGGLTYYIQKQEAKLLLNYGRFQYDDAKPNNEVILAAQLSY